VPESDSAATPALKRNVQWGMVALGIRSGLQNLVILVANVYLARWLEPRDFGIFAILQFATSFFRIVSDTGLGTALVQQKETPSETELSTIWWLQLGVGLALSAASFALVPVLPKVWTSMPPEAAWLLPALAVGLLFTMLQSVPFLILEREVRFGWVGTLEFVGTVTFYGTALVLAARHAGSSALVGASVGQAALVSIAAHMVQPWKPKLRFDLKSIRRLLKFGAAFQGGNALTFANAAVTPLIVGARLGSEALGIIQFAESAAFFPSVIVGLVRRVYFPFLCRLQNDKVAFRREFEQAVVLCAIPTFFFFAIFIGTGPAIVSIVYSDKWLPAVPALMVFSFAFCFTFFSWIGDALMAALDDMGRLFRIKVVSMSLNWVATLLAIAWRPTTFAFAIGFSVQLIVTPLLILAAARDLVPGVEVAGKLRGLALAAVALACVGRLALPYLVGAASLAAFVLLALVFFVGLALLVDARLRGIARTYWSDFSRGKGPAGAAVQPVDG
jgi:O-antigen/teichoic acid export membrane protein